MRRYLRLLRIFWSATVQAELEYRLNFVSNALLSLFWLVWAVLGVGVYFRFGETVNGWSYPELLVVMGWFFAVNGLRQALIQPNLGRMTEYVRMGTLDEKRAIAAFTGGPAKSFGIPGGSLSVGAVADICVIDPERPLMLTADAIASKSKNSPFLGQTLAGRAVLTLVEGRAVHDLDGRLK